MSDNKELPDTLYKYLDSAGMEKFLNSPGVLFSSVATFSDCDEGVCASWLPGGQTDSMIHKEYEDSLYGILCLSSDPSSEQMWKEYAENHCGIMVGLDPRHPFFSQEPFQKLWNKAEYDDNAPVLPPAPMEILLGIGDDKEYREAVYAKLRQGIRRKGTQYRFEEEWRKGAILSKPRSKRPFPFPEKDIPSIIRSITMGANISQVHKRLCQEFTQRYGILLNQS